MSDLEGATTPPKEGVSMKNAGEFAASWNATTPENREHWFKDFQVIANRATNCIIANHDLLFYELQVREEMLREAWRDLEGLRSWVIEP